jgi:hypothetical protein
MTRTDVHAPASASFDPTLYTLDGVYDTHPEEGDHRELNKAIRALEAAGYKHFAHNLKHGGCGHCGARLRYVALMTRADVREWLFVGETCLDNRFSGTKADFDALREDAKARRVQRALAHGVALLVNENPALMPLLDSNHPAMANEFVADIARKLTKYGEISERQQDAVIRAIARQAEWTARDEARAAEKAALVATGVKAPTGKVTVTGTVLSTKIQDGYYGTQYKMLVQHADGWKVWSTVPAALDFDNLKGRTITFTATLEPSKDDALFAFAKRPSKATLAA